MTDQPPPRNCTACKHVMLRKVGDYDYPTCLRSSAPTGTDGTFCGQMRLVGGQCGPDGTLWEAA